MELRGRARGCSCHQPVPGTLAAPGLGSNRVLQAPEEADPSGAPDNSFPLGFSYCP